MPHAPPFLNGRRGVFVHSIIVVGICCLCVEKALAEVPANVDTIVEEPAPVTPPLQDLFYWHSFNVGASCGSSFSLGCAFKMSCTGKNER